MPRELNQKQKAFIREYVKDFNATQAAIRAGYSKKTAGSQSFDLMQKPEIQDEIAEAVKNASESAEVTVERVLKELSAIAFVDPADIFNDDGTLKPLSQIPEQARRAIAGLEIKTSGEDSEITKIKDAKSISIPEDSSFTMVVHGANTD